MKAIAPVAIFLGALGPAGAVAGIGVEVISGIIGWMYGAMLGQELSDVMWSHLEQAGSTPARIDPIVLDISGSGITTIPVSHGVYYDLDNNGFSEKTGWIDAKSGILVLDKDANGQIETGNELFGDRTILEDGKTASSGFAALAALDSNRDGVIDAKDDKFSELRIWVDRDGDGFSAPDELMTLEEAGVKSLNLSHTFVGQVDENGNTIARVGSFTRADGTTAEMKEFFLQRDTKDVQMTHSVEIPEDIMDMPELHPMGNTYSLRQAMVRDESGKLKQLVQDFVNDTNIESRQTKLHDILFAWAGVSDVKPASRGSNFDARKLAVLETVTGTSYRNSPTSSPTAAEAPILERSYTVLAESVYTMLSLQTNLAEVFKKFNYSFNLESETPIKLDVTSVQAYLDEQLQADAVGGEKLLAEVTRVLRNRGLVSEAEFAGLRDHFAKQSIKYQQIIDTAPLTTLVGTDANESMSGVVDRDNVVAAGAGNDSLNGSTRNDLLYGDAGDDTLYGREGDDILVGGEGNERLYGGRGNDTYVFSRGDGVDDIYEQDGTDTIQFGAGISPDDVALRLVNLQGSEIALEITIKGSGDKIIVHEHGGLRYHNSPHIAKPQYQIESIIFADGTAWDAVEIHRRAHDVSGSDKSESWVALDDSSFTYHGFDGNDTINGGVADDWLYGDGGDDHLRGNKGNDTLSGGAGRDTLYGESGDDSYVFSRGDGIDTVHEESGFDTVRFGDDITPQDVALRAISTHQNGISLEMTIKGSDDKLIIERQFGLYSYNQPDSPLPRHQIEQVVFSDGTAWSLDEIERRAYEVRGTNERDIMSVASSRSVTYYGEGGDDSLQGGRGDDRLYGGDGDDRLSGDTGKNLLVGGRGNDTMSGFGADTYVFEKGDGQDRIDDYGGFDIIQLGEGIRPDDVTLKRVYNHNDYDLEMELGDGDKVTVSQYFGRYNVYGRDEASPSRMIEEVRFADGTVWTQQTIYDKMHHQVGTNGNDNISPYDRGAVEYHGLGGNDYLTGSDGDDKLYGGEGNDTLSGGEGNDLFVGGGGDDTISSYKGDDTYIFNRGDGIDRISDYGGLDRLKLGEGITPNDVIVRRFKSNYDAHLELSFRGVTDKIIIERHFGSGSYSGFSETDRYKIDEISFADGTIWTPQTLHDILHDQTGTDGNDTMTIYDDHDTVFRGMGGDDTLYGRGGNDILSGGTGNDRLSGGGGDDSYIFNRGDGQDAIDETGGADTVIFGEGIHPGDVIVNRVVRNYSAHLTLTIKGTDDVLTIEKYFGDGGYSGMSASPRSWVEKFVFADGTEWSMETIHQKMHDMVGTDGNDSMHAYDDERVIFRGLAGNDSLSGRKADDALYGDDGNDSLNGNEGNDVLDGGTGNDYLSGGAGDDVYVFRAGDGQDTIYDYGAAGDEA
ncbi:MAG: calcium-binding protein, partial [Candidatus Saccharibacteria bacterium]|nr:calcium-binding protein [Candidatus Saccharibacteria bacterium]